MIREQYEALLKKMQERATNGDEGVLHALKSLRDYYNGGTNFSAMVYLLFAKADPINKMRMGKGFPVEFELLTLCEAAVTFEDLSFAEFQSRFEFTST